MCRRVEKSLSTSDKGELTRYITGETQVFQLLSQNDLIHQALTDSADEISPLRDPNHFNTLALLCTNAIGRNDGVRYVSVGVIAICMLIACSRILSGVISTGRIRACWCNSDKTGCVGEWRNLSAPAEKAFCIKS